MVNFFTPFGSATKTAKRSNIVFWVTLLFLFWQFYPSALMPRPKGTWDFMVWLYGRGLLVDVWVSTWVILRASFFYAFPIGCLLSYVYTIPFFQPPVIFIASLRNLSMGALIAMGIMLAFSGDLLKVVTMSFVILVYFVSSITPVIDAISQDEIDHGIAMRMSAWQILWHRVVRGRFYEIATNFIPCIAMGWAMLSFVEGVARGLGGIGDLMLQTDKINNFNGILALSIIAVICGLAISLGLQFLLRKACPYAAVKATK